MNLPTPTVSVSALDVASDPDRAAAVSLAVVTDPGDDLVEALISALGPAQAWDAVRDTTTGELARYQSRVATFDLLEVLRRTDEAGARLLFPGTPAWPTGATDLPNAPLVLWARGTLTNVDWASSVVLTGARAATSYGLSQAGELGYDLAAAGHTIVTGASFGIDAAAHRGALCADAPTVAVLAGGVDRPYPVAHSQLLDQIAATGMVVSAAPIGAGPSQTRFQTRSALLASLTPAVVVVESGARGGALRTLGHAERLGRVTGAVCGPVTSAASQGTNAAIKDGRAAMIRNAADVIDLLAAHPVR